MRKQKTHTTATRSPPKNLGKVKDLSAAHDVYWVLMPLHKSGPYGDGCISPGDFSVSATKDQFFANLFNIMATVVEEPKDGGWLLDVSKDNQRLRDSVIEGIAKFAGGTVPKPGPPPVGTEVENVVCCGIRCESTSSVFKGVIVPSFAAWSSPFMGST